MATKQNRFTPDPAVKRLARFYAASLALLPLLLIALNYQAMTPTNFGAALFLLVVSILGYLGYLLFAIILLKEYYPETKAGAGWLTLLPPLLALVAYTFIGGSAIPFLLAWGMLLFCGLELAVMIIFTAGTHLQVVEPNRLSWRKKGRSLWSDPDFSPMARWSVGLIFFVPGVLAILSLHLGLIEREILPVEELSPERLALGAIWWIISLAAITFQFVRQLAPMGLLGRIFGPGKDAFSS